MTRRKTIRMAKGVALAALAAVSAPVLASGALSMLDTLDRGGWEIRYRDGGGIGRVCLRSGRELIQIRHPGSGCSRIVVADGAKAVTVQYTCQGNGYGRTEIRKETSGLVQIESQGIVHGKPFQISAEARRTGACAR